MRWRVQTVEPEVKKESNTQNKSNADAVRTKTLLQDICPRTETRGKKLIPHQKTEITTAVREQPRHRQVTFSKQIKPIFSQPINARRNRMERPVLCNREREVR
jgi:hypothetical protein